MARLAYVASLVHVVYIAKDGVAHPVGEAEGEKSCQPPLFCSACHFHICYTATLVLRFQIDVHDVLLRFGIVAESDVHVGLLLIDLQFLHRVVRQVLHQYLLVAPHE